MNRFLFSLLLLSAQPIFCGGIISYIVQYQDDDQEFSTNGEQEDNSDEVQQDVTFECTFCEEIPQFKIGYKEASNTGLIFDSYFSWDDADAQDSCDAISRRLKNESDSAKQRALRIALRNQRILFPETN